MRSPKINLYKRERYILFVICAIVIAVLLYRLVISMGFGVGIGVLAFVIVLLIAVAIMWCTHIRLHDLIARKLSQTSFFQNRISWDSDDEVLESVLELPNTESQNEKPEISVPQQKDKELSLRDMIMLDDDKKQILLTKIGDYISKGVKGKKIAFMIIALRNLGYLLDVTSDRQLFNAIRQEFDADIGTDKGIYTYLDSQTAKHHQAEIDTLKNYFSLNSVQSNSI